jgi:arylformamidase
VDAPVHFLPGAGGIERLPLEALIGPAYSAHLPRVDMVTAAALQAARVPQRVARLLVRTRNSNFWRAGEPDFQEAYAALTPDAAEWVADRGIRLIGVDYLSVAPYKRTRPTHEILLRAGVVIVEGLNLDRVRPGRYEFVCLPLKLVGSDGAPARAILIKRGRA